MMHGLIPFRFSMLILFFTLSACGLTDWANAHMPVIGQRCEHWQCFTEGGQLQSDMNQQERLKEEGAVSVPPGAKYPSENPVPIKLPLAAGTGAAPASAATSATVPLAAAPAATTPEIPLEPANPEGGAYKYVPRAPATPGTTPFDGQF